MNTINGIKANPYVLDPLPVHKGYLFPTNRQNNKLNFAANFITNPTRTPNKEIKAQTDKLKNLMVQIEKQNQNGKQLNTLI